ncbi:hypothetical protein, partial [Halomonas sp. SYSU XM8]|uniref:hypothetical protein n=1 Tax=Halomonas sp. SYSU XM8 TaxID=2109329 RepID=UPI001C6356D3
TSCKKISRHRHLNDISHTARFFSIPQVQDSACRTAATKLLLQSLEAILDPPAVAFTSAPHRLAQ